MVGCCCAGAGQGLPAATNSSAATAAQAQNRVPVPAGGAGSTLPTGFARVIVLWPEGAPLAKGSAPGDVPKLYYYPPSGAGVSYPAAGTAVGSAVIVFPGGGYRYLETDRSEEHTSELQSLR